MENELSPRCRNCEEEFFPEAKFCPHCGQKNTDGRFSFKDLFSHFLDDAFSLDNRIFKTMGALFVPGKLTQDFFVGKQIRYYHPMRLFLLSVAVLIATVTLTFDESEMNMVNSIWEKRKERSRQVAFYHQLDSLVSEVKSDWQGDDSVVALDTLLLRFVSKDSMLLTDSLELPQVISFSNGSHQAIKVSSSDLLQLSPKEMADKYSIKGYWKRLIFFQNIRILKSFSNFLFYMVGNFFWMALFMMPLLALVLKLLYIKCPFLYYEHLLFSFHTHIFGFIFFTLIILLAKWTHVAGFIFIGFYFFIYTLLAMKRFYAQGWYKTILKFILANLFYVFILLFSIFLFSIVSIFLF